jgi:hypothetical protein
VVDSKYGPRGGGSAIEIHMAGQESMGISWHALCELVGCSVHMR